MDTSQLAKKIKHGIKWQAIISVASQVIYFINGVILARILGPKEFGIYGMAQIVSSFVWMFWQLGLNAAIVQRKEIDRAHLDTAFTISVVMGIICAIITWFSAPFIADFFNEPKVIPLTRVIALTFIIYSLDRIPSALLGRELRFKEAAIPGLLNAFLYPIVAIPMALMGFGAMSFVWGVVAGAVGMLLVRYYWLFKYFDWRPRIGFDKKSAKDLLGFGVFLTLTNILNFFLWNLQKIITGKYLGATDLGYYNRAANLSSLPLKKIYSLVGSVLLPTFSRIQDNHEKLRDWFRKFNFLTYVVISPPLIYFMFFAKPFIYFVFGDKWVESAWILRFTSFWGLLSIPTFYWTNMLNAKGHPNVLFGINVIRLPVLAVSLFVAIRYGLKGVVYTIFGNSIFTFLLFVYSVKRFISLPFRDHLISLFEPLVINTIAAVMGWLVGSVISSNELVSFFLGTALFSGVVLMYYIVRWFKYPYLGLLKVNVRELVRV